MGTIDLTAEYLAWLAGPNANKTGPTARGASVVKPVPAQGDIWDDFDGPAGVSPDPALWNRVSDTAFGISSIVAEQSALDGNSHLAITAILQADGSWLSGIVEAAQTMEYGTYSAAMKLPPGHGMHASFWMMGPGHSWSPPGGWPQCGETDIMEHIDDGNGYSTVHGPVNSVPAVSSYQSQIKWPFGFDPSKAFHVYTLTKLAGHAVHFLVDGQDVGAIGAASIPPGQPWELEAPQKPIFSLSVSGPSDWGGGTNANTPNPAVLLVDWFHFIPDPNA